MVKVGLSSTKEPAGLLRADGEWPNGFTIVLWQADKTAAV